jgi:hypothetical protein
MRAGQGSQILQGPNIPKREKYTKHPEIMPNGHKLNQMTVTYYKW